MSDHPQLEIAEKKENGIMETSEKEDAATKDKNKEQPDSLNETKSKLLENSIGKDSTKDSLSSKDEESDKTVSKEESKSQSKESSKDPKEEEKDVSMEMLHLSSDNSESVDKNKNESMPVTDKSLNDTEESVDDTRESIDESMDESINSVQKDRAELRKRRHSEQTEEKPTEGRAKRERKKVDRYVQEVKKEEIVPTGSGVPLGDIPFINAMIAKTTPEDLKLMHRLAYGRPGTALEVRRNLRKFNGFGFTKEDHQFERKHQYVERAVIAELKKILIVFGLERSGVKMDLVDRISNFMLKPVDAGKAVPESKKRERSRKRSTGKPNNKKRKPEKAVDSSNNSESGGGGEDEEEQELEHVESDSEPETSKKTPKPKSKKPAKKTPVRSTEKKKTNKRQKRTEPEPEPDSDSSDDDIPIAKKHKPQPPSETEIRTFIKKLLDKANLEEVTMKKLCQQVYDNYPSHDLTHKKDFIKSTVKSILS